MISRFILWLFQLMFFAWTAPRTWVAAEIVTAAIGNVHWRDNFTYLKTQQDLDDTHRAASAAVHGLPASVNVLGNRNAAGEFVQRGSASSGSQTASVDGTLGTANGTAVTFPVAFSNLRCLVVTANCSSNALAMYTTAASVTGFAPAFFCKPAGASFTESFYWLALGD